MAQTIHKITVRASNGQVLVISAIGHRAHREICAGLDAHGIKYEQPGLLGVAGYTLQHVNEAVMAAKHFCWAQGAL